MHHKVFGSRLHPDPPESIQHSTDLDLGGGVPEGRGGKEGDEG